jgi:glycosyltransferase involved in cell wall biosynthesis
VKPEGKVFVVAHVSRIYGPVQALTRWLREQKADFTLVSLPFAYSGIPRATEQAYSDGAESYSREGHASQGWEPWLWVKDWIFAFRRGWAAGKGKPVDIFIGVDCLNASAGLALRALGRAHRVGFYVIDYTPKRFRNPVLNAVYAFVDRLAAKRSDFVWNLSERMREVRRRQGVREEANLLVPVGVELSAVRPVPESEIRRRTLLYMGALMDNKGLQLMIEAFPEIAAQAPGAELHILGFGPYEAEVKRLAAESPAGDRIFVPGGLGHGELFKVVPTFGVALAPYLDDPGSYTWWCDPTKPKEYLACGLPLVITKVPWLWERVADPDRPMGVAIDYRREELVAACVRLLNDDEFYGACRRNALEFARGLDWDGIYGRAFADLGGRRGKSA